MEKDDTGIAVVENPVFNAINLFSRRRDFEEELRILYVILTRCREQLYIFGKSPSKNPYGYIENAELLASFESPYFARKIPSAMQAVIGTCGKLGSLFVEDISSPDNIEYEQEKKALDDGIGKSAQSSSDKDTVKEILKERFLFKSPLAHLERLPEKLSVSNLSPSVLDEAEKFAVTLPENDTEALKDSDGKKPLLPSFISGTAADESARRGIATHMFLQFCDLDLLSKNGSEAELCRLVERKFLSKEDAERVRLSEIDKFIKSELFSKMKSAKALYRELRFNVKLPAECFTEDEELRAALSGEELLVQGVIDCIIETDNGNIHLVDYKTDRLTKEELFNPDLAKTRLIKAHGQQLSLYSLAAERMFSKKPASVGIYSLQLGCEITL